MKNDNEYIEDDKVKIVLKPVQTKKLSNTPVQNFPTTSLEIGQ